MNAMTTATETAETEILTFQNATVYMLGEMGMGFRGTHFKVVHLTIRPWAQYPRAVELEGLRPRCKH